MATWITAHVIDSALDVKGAEAYVTVPPQALEDVEPLGVATVLVTRAPVDSGFDAASQTMVMLEYDTEVASHSDSGRIRSIASEAIVRLQHHGVAPSGNTHEIAVEYGDPMIKTFQQQIQNLS